MTSRYLEILKDWNFWEREINTGFIRSFYLDKLFYLVSIDQIVAISGIRRIGKSTILRQFIEALNNKGEVPYINTLHINFEDPRFSRQDLDANDLFDIYEEYKNALKPKGKIYLFLDEVQVVSRWEKFVRTLFDLKHNVSIIVTGSNSSVFSSALSKILTGRLIEMVVHPLSYSEFLLFKKSKTSTDSFFDEYLRFGGFPLVVLEEDERKKRDILINFYNEVLEDDVIIRHGIKNKTKIKKLALFLLSNSGNLISTYSLEKMLGISDGEVSRYLNLLEESYLISRVPLFSYSVKKQIYNPDKVFCVDTGLANTAGFAFSENKGRLLENVVYNRLATGEKKVYYWKNGTKIDFALQQGLEVSDLINVTTTVDDEVVKKRELLSLETGKKEFPKAKTTLLTLYNQSKQPDLQIKSLEKFLLEE